jgi:TetR/AcrR family transcriptional regulator, fatty acid biosynthesis regulator
VVRSQPSLSRKEQKELTRRRLVEGAIDILRAEGVAAATTVRIARAAGIAQSSFYSHFADRDACLQAAAERIGEAVLRAVGRVGHTRQVDGIVSSLRTIYEAVVDAFVSEPELTRIFLRYRSDDESPLGRAFRALVDRARANMLRSAHELGISQSALANVAIHVDLLIGSTLGVVEGLVEGRLPDRDAAVDVLVSSTAAVIRGTLQLEGRT